MPRSKKERTSASWGSSFFKTEEKKNRVSRVEEIVNNCPFVFSGNANVSPLGDFDFLSGKSRIPCTTVISHSAKA